MTLLLDTHTFLWYASNSPRLPKALSETLRRPEHDLWLSAVSAWEIGVKAASGRLPLPIPAWDFIDEARRRHAISSLSVKESAVRHLPKLPDVHRDPFDRMLVCQAIEHQLTIVTNDPLVRKYPVKTLWSDSGGPV